MRTRRLFCATTLLALTTVAGAAAASAASLEVESNPVPRTQVVSLAKGSGLEKLTPQVWTWRP